MEPGLERQRFYMVIFLADLVWWQTAVTSQAKDKNEDGSYSRKKGCVFAEK